MRRLPAFVLLVPVVLAFGACAPSVSPPPHAVTLPALFDPTGTPPVIPLPNDLLFTGGDGVHLNVPDLPGDSPAQRELNAYLRTLDGFPSSTSGSARFGGALAAGSVRPPSMGDPGSVVVIDQMAGQVLDASAVKTSLSQDGTTVSITPVKRWKSGDRYAVLIFGDADPAGVKGAMGELVVASPSFFFLRAQGPLVVRCGDVSRAECLCPPAALADPNDTTCHSAVRGLDTPTARAAELQREKFAPALDAALAVAGNRSRNDVVLFWTFTISDQPMTVFDPDRGDVPFPNDVLINPMTGLVSLPIVAGDPQAPLKMQLNTLDGFSTSAAETDAIDSTGTTLDPATLLPSQTAFLVNLAPTGAQPEFAVAPAGDQIAIQPLTALQPDQDKYAVVLTTHIADTAGRALVPPPSVVLATGPSPLFDGMHSTVSVLSDAQAAQLEVLRQALQPLVAQLGALGLDRSQLAALWTFTTQSIARPLLALDQFPTLAALPTAVTLTHVATTGDLASAAGTLPYPVGNLQAVAFGTFQSESAIDPTAGQIVFSRQMVDPMVPQRDLFAVKAPAGAPATTVPFFISIPKLAPPGGAPVVILQHGFTEWRGQMIALADGFAQLGWAAIAIDIDGHGARSRCTADNQCVGGGAGSCDVATGVCSTGLALVPTSADPLACAIAPLTGNPNDCRPVASGATFINPGNLFLTRANGEQYVIDAAQLVRVLKDASPTGLTAQLAGETPTLVINPSTLGFFGHSLGAIGGAVFLSVAPEPKVAVLNAVGGHDFEMLASGGFASIVDQYLMQIGVMRGTPEFAQLEQTADWVLDPIDPWNVGKFIVRAPLTSYLTGTPNAPKMIIQEEPGMDMTIPPPFQEAFALELFGPGGLDANHHVQGRQNDGTVVSTYFPNAGHSTVIYLQPDPAGGAAMRAQLTTFITTSGATLPAP